MLFFSSHNNFSTFPWCLTKLQSARVLILNGNKFEGIPEEFGNLVHAEDIVSLLVFAKFHLMSLHLIAMYANYKSLILDRMLIII